jgi:hypothetical protein
MRKWELSFVLAVTIVVVSVSPSFATLLGIFPGEPTLTYDSNGVTTYTASSNAFTVTASPIAILFPPPYPQIPRLVTPTGSPASEVVSVGAVISNTGSVIGGVAGSDLVIQGQVDADGNGSIDFSGILLTGEILQFGFEDSGGATDRFDYRFVFTGGALGSFFVGQDIGMTETSEHSTFVNDFGINFGGGAKGTVGPIAPLPEPSTMVLMFVAGLPLIRRRFGSK